jgi:autotransporter translocation and assembly factor TamB
MENVNLTAKVRDVRLRCGAEIDAGIAEADFTLVDTVEQFLLRGDVTLAETRYTQTIDLTQLAERAVRGGGQRVPAAPSLLEKLRLRIRVRLNRNVIVDSDLGRALLKGGLTLSGPASSPSIIGEVAIVRGHVYYLDRTFEIRRGPLGFFDPYELNPQINLMAESEVFAFSPGGDQRRYMVTLRVGGTLQDPVINLTSEPELSPPQIVSLLTLGTTQPGIGADITERARELLTQQLAGFGTRKLERLLNVEDITISGNIFDLQGPTGPRLAITKRITSRLALTYQTAVGDLDVQKALVSFRLFRFLFLEGETTTQGEGGVDLKFTKSW